ncbi:apolipoprotein N-acyltransferase [Paraglaciecola sp. L1A13]|uniref:apolipoprotein N-acyltransferase n=1 Tax=Paraglaciecola sp. L1A13 TaxID=2686359 RepID=UPI00131D905E|nr:apolipoprotein N-acyltransferase [Paraglaciecola sp. L1A13]
MLYFLSLLTGASLTLSYAPFSYWAVMPIALTGYLCLLYKARVDQAAKVGFSFGLGWFGAGISWVHVSIADFGGLPLVGSLGLMLLLCSYLSLYPMIFSKLARRYFSPNVWGLTLPFVWLLCEWARGIVLTGFPWLSIGYSQMNSPLSGWLPVIGEFGVSALLMALCAASAIWLMHKRYIAPMLLCASLYLSGWVLNTYKWVVPTGEPVKIAMVQGNIAQEIRWAPEQDWPTMKKYLELTEAHWDNQVIIWPEAAIPQLEPIAVDYLTQLDEEAAQHKTGLLTGIVNYNFETRQAYNSIIGVGLKEHTDTKGHYQYPQSNRFDKHHLLPVGEYIPLEDWLRGLAPIFDLPMSSFTRGDYQQANLVSNGFYFAPALCFEIVFPNQIRENLYAKTDFIITVSNDAWFGHSHGPAQHLEIAQVRAKEFGLPVLRATNNGITAFIDASGAIQSRLPQFETAVLTDKIQRVSGITPYRYFGNLTAWLVTVLGLIIAIRLHRAK